MIVSLTARSSKSASQNEPKDEAVTEEPVEINETMYSYFEVAMDSSKELSNYDEGNDDYDYAEEIALEDLDSLIQCADLEEVSTVEEI